MKPLSSLTAWLMLAAFCSAAQPKSVITVVDGGPASTTAPGSIIFTSEGSSSDLTEATWAPPAGIQAMEGLHGRIELSYRGTTPINSSLTLITVGANPADSTKPIVAVNSIPVQFGGSAPIPPAPVPPTPPTPVPVPPQPVPVPPVPVPPVPVPPTPVPPVPSLPDGKYKLAALAYSEGMKVPQASRVAGARIQSELGKLIAANVSNTATDWDHIQSIGHLANVALSTGMGQYANDWADWYKTMQSAVNVHYQSGRLNSVPDFLTAMQEIALGAGQIQ